MNEEELLLRAIIDNPQDDTLRLVYADWLDEHGDPRGTLIRVQLALTQVQAEVSRLARELFPLAARSWTLRHDPFRQVGEVLSPYPAEPQYASRQTPPQLIEALTDRERSLGGTLPSPTQLALFTAVLEQRVELRRQERELLDRFGAVWAGPFAERGWSIVFRRGLPSTFVPRVAGKQGMVRPLIRPPGPHMICEVAGAPPQWKLPFVVGVLADLSGRPESGRAPLRDRPFTSIDRDTFGVVLAAIRPELRLDVPVPEGDAIHIELSFERMEDFEPARLVERVPELRRLLETGSPRISSVLARVLHHPDFQRLEATWRGLSYLVHQTATGPTLEIRALDVSKRELLGDQSGADTPDRSALMRKVLTNELGSPGGRSFGLLVGGYEFDHGPEDIRLLHFLGGVAATARAPFVAAAAPGLFGFARFTELTTNRDLTGIPGDSEHDAWRSFRASDESRWVALTLPRVLARWPYGASFRPADGLEFEELIDGQDHDRFLWMSAAWAFAARVTGAFDRFAWPARIHGVEGGAVDGLPFHAATDAGETVPRCCAEIALGPDRAAELADLGFLPLAHSADRDVFLSARSCHRPEVTDTALPPARLDYLLCLSRFVHALQVLTRDRMRVSRDIAEVQHWLNRWLAGYVSGWPAGTTDPPLVTYYRMVLVQEGNGAPLAAGRVAVRPVADKPGSLELEIRLNPTWQLEAPGHAVRLTAEVSLP